MAVAVFAVSELLGIETSTVAATFELAYKVTVVVDASTTILDKNGGLSCY
jgi:hypothetical protein